MVRYKIEEIKNKIIQGDALKILKQIPDETADCLITDPPYKISIKGNKIIRTYKHYNWKRRSDIGLDFGEWDRFWKDEKDYYLWTEEWFKECVRILKSGAWLYIFFDKQKTGLFDLWLAPKYGVKARTIYVWVKTNPVPSFRKVNWNSGTEHIWVGTKGESRLKNFKDQKYMSNYFIYPNASAWKKTSHPTEKPEELIEHLIEVNTNKGELVLDPFTGSGTIPAVCKKLKRDFIAIEISKEYCEIARQRLKTQCETLI